MRRTAKGCLSRKARHIPTPQTKTSLPQASCSDAAVEAAFRQLRWAERWRATRDVWLGRTRGRPEPAAMLAWLGRRELHRIPWNAGVLLAAVLTIALWPGDLVGRAGFAPWAGFVGAFAGMLLRVPRLHRAIAANQEVMRASGIAVPIDRPPRVIDGWFVLGSATTIAVLAAFLWWASTWTFDFSGRFPPVPPESPVDAPAALADGRPPGAVPAEVAAAWPGREVVAGEQAPEMIDGAEQCDDGVRWSDGPATGPVLLGPTTVQVSLRGTVRDVEQIVLCEYTADGTLLDRTVTPLLTVSGWDFIGGMSGGGADTHSTHRNVLAPPEAVWALIDQGLWVLALPIDGAPAVRVRITTRTDEPVQMPTLGVVRFVTADGETIEDR
jgi:hypothetical protein